MDEYLVGIKKPHVNDLFMGSGTTDVCAITRGYKASGTDINYISELITRVKCTPINPVLLRERIGIVLSDLSFLESDTLFANYPITPYVPETNSERIDYWFKPVVKEELGTILYRVREESDINIRNLFTVCFSHILKTVSIWLMRSTKPTRDFKKKIQKPSIFFKRHLKKMEKANKEFWSIIFDYFKYNLNEYLNIRREVPKKVRYAQI
jgi:hypothetical protein